MTELDLIDGKSIRFVVPSTVAPRYNPRLGHLQSPDNTNAEYVQKTPYSISFQVHIQRSKHCQCIFLGLQGYPKVISQCRYIDTLWVLVKDQYLIILEYILGQRRNQLLSSVICLSNDDYLNGNNIAGIE